MKANLSGSFELPSAATDFRLLLQERLAQRCARNPRYSLRAFARQLGVDHSTLSQFLRGKRALTVATIEKLGRRLGLDDAERSRYAAAGVRPGADGLMLREVQRLTRETVSLIADWHHYAILELLRLDDFRPDVRWIARVLGVTPDEVNLAVTRLLQLRLLEMAKDGSWRDLSGDAAASLSDFSQVAVQRLAEQVAEISRRAALDHRPGRGDVSAVTLAVASSRVPEAVRRIARFRRELVAWLSGGGARDDVYRMEIGLYPLTRLSGERSEDGHGTTGHAVAGAGAEAGRSGGVLPEGVRLGGGRREPAELPAGGHRLEAGHPGGDLARPPGRSRVRAAHRPGGGRRGRRAQGARARG